MSRGSTPEPGDHAPGSLHVHVPNEATVDASIGDRDLAIELIRRLRARGDAELSKPDARIFGMLEIELEQRVDLPPNRFSRAKMASLFRTIGHHPDFSPSRLRGAAVADLGCGKLNPLGCVLVPVLAGAARGIGVDAEAIEDHGLAMRALFRCASAMLASPGLVVGDYPLTQAEVLDALAGFDLAKLCRGDASGLDRRRLEFRQASFERAGFADGELDIVFTNALFEHVTEPAAMVQELARVTSRGGLGTHVIDVSDHRHYGTPGLHALEFLTVASRDAIVHGSNRVRVHAFGELFERHGFEVRRAAVLDRVPVTAALRARLVEPFRSMSDEQLEPKGVILHVRRR